MTLPCPPGWEARFFRKVCLHFGSEVEDRCRELFREAESVGEVNEVEILRRAVHECYAEEIANADALANMHCNSD